MLSGKMIREVEKYPPSGKDKERTIKSHCKRSRKQGKWEEGKTYQSLAF